MFHEMMSLIREEIVSLILRVEVREENPLQSRKINLNYNEHNEIEQFRENSLSENTAKQKPVTASIKAGRNDPCPCGSGKKYKKCCGAN